MKIKLFFTLLFFLLLICSATASNYKFQNTSGIDLVTIFGDFGNMSVLENISVGGYFIGDGSFLTNLNGGWFQKVFIPKDHNTMV